MRNVFLLSLLTIGCAVHHNNPLQPIIDEPSNNTETPPAINDPFTPTSPNKPGTINVEETGQSCTKHSDCASNACRYDHVCITERSCVEYLGGNSCGSGEIGEPNAQHESCCKTLPVAGYIDPTNPDKQVYLDKYEVTAGRMRVFIQDITRQIGKPDIKSWIQSHYPEIWDAAWDKFLPSDNEGGAITIDRMLLGDPRHLGQTQEEAGPGVIVPPPTDQTVNLGVNYQFGPQIFVDTHGNNCGVFPDSYGSPTYYYPPEILALHGEVIRPNGLGYNGLSIPAQEYLDTKSMNCVTNVLLHAFCVWSTNGEGRLATSEVLDFVVNSPARPINVSGCGSQYDNHGNLLGNDFNGTVQTGGICPPVSLINASFDAGDVLPVPGSPLNKHNYHYPDIGNTTADKSWQIAPPGRVIHDIIKISPADEGWMDLAGNLNEAVLETNNGIFTGKFGLKHRGIGFGSARSDLNVLQINNEPVLRVQRPEAKSALVGGRCQRYK